MCPQQITVLGPMKSLQKFLTFFKDLLKYYSHIQHCAALCNV